VGPEFRGCTLNTLHPRIQNRRDTDSYQPYRGGVIPTPPLCIIVERCPCKTSFPGCGSFYQSAFTPGRTDLPHAGAHNRRGGVIPLLLQRIRIASVLYTWVNPENLPAPCGCRPYEGNPRSDEIPNLVSCWPIL